MFASEKIKAKQWVINEPDPLIKNAGGIWDADNKYWKLDRHQVKNLGLEKCVV